MLEKFYVNNNAQPESNDHEVHREGCFWLSVATNMKYLGEFSNCHDAVREAKKYYDDTNGCKHCCPNCHTT